MRTIGIAVMVVWCATGVFSVAGAADGKMLFEQNCGTCHGADGKGVQGLGKDLTASEFAIKKTDAELVAFIKEGRPADDPLNTTGILMPPNAGNPALTDDDLKSIVTHMRSLHAKKGS